MIKHFHRFFPVIGLSKAPDGGWSSVTFAEVTFYAKQRQCGEFPVIISYIMQLCCKIKIDAGKFLVLKR